MSRRAARSPARARVGACKRAQALSVLVEARGYSKFESLQRVVREDVREVLLALTGALLDPAERSLMLDHALRPRNLSVCDVAAEGVEEGVFGLPFHARGSNRAHNLSPRELVQRVCDVPVPASAHRGERPRPEDLADHRCVLEQRLGIRRESVEPRSDQRLDRLRVGQLLDGSERPAFAMPEEQAAVLEHADELLGVERVAA
jgi:hypothetical protein